MTSRADDFGELVPDVLKSWREWEQQLEANDPALLSVLWDRFATGAPIPVIHAALEAVGVNLTIASLRNWKADVLRR